MTNCQHCHAKLNADGLTPGQQVRCSQCLEFSMYGRIEKVSTDRLAWRSFWLGLSSILLLFFTGIPAIYYGVRSLLRMRFVKPKPVDRAAALIGTGLGSCFGVLLGFIIATSAFGLLLVYLTSHSTNQATEIVEQCQLYFHYKLPSQVMPVLASTEANSQHTFRFADHRESDQQHLLVCLVHFSESIQSNGGLFEANLNRKAFDDRSKGKSIGTATLAWDMNGNPVQVTKRTYHREDPSLAQVRDNTTLIDSINELPRIAAPDVTIQYIGFFRSEHDLYGMTVLIEPAHCSLDEGQVQEMFRNVSAISK